MRLCKALFRVPGHVCSPSQHWTADCEEAGGFVFSGDTEIAPPHHHYVFCHGDRISALRRAWRIAAEAEFWQGKCYYRPVRYDVSLGGLGVRPGGRCLSAGEAQETRVRTDGLIPGELAVDEPAPPPRCLPSPNGAGVRLSFPVVLDGHEQLVAVVGGEGKGFR